jgi:hypothetical protein
MNRIGRRVVDQMQASSEDEMRVRQTLLASTVTLVTLVPAAGASAHVHGITPLFTLANDCGVTSLANTGANRAQAAVISGLIPRDVGNAGLAPGDGGFGAPVGCAD